MLHHPGARPSRVLVTGASGAIGAAIAASLSTSGWSIVGLSRSTREPTEHVHDWIEADLLELPSLPRHLDVHAVVHAAGYFRSGLALRPNASTMEELLRVHATAPAQLNAAALPTMLRAGYGRIVFVSAAAADMGDAGLSSYGASKAAQHGLVRALAREYGSRGVTTNAVSPGFIDSPIVSGLDEAALAERMARVPAGRLGRPDEVATVVEMLLSEGGGYVNGAIIPVDGGLGMGR